MVGPKLLKPFFHPRVGKVCGVISPPLEMGVVVFVWMIKNAFMTLLCIAKAWLGRLVSSVIYAKLIYS